MTTKTMNQHGAKEILLAFSYYRNQLKMSYKIQIENNLHFPTEITGNKTCIFSEAIARKSLLISQSEANNFNYQ
jgi:hypothetical protein